MGGVGATLRGAGGGAAAGAEGPGAGTKFGVEVAGAEISGNVEVDAGAEAGADYGDRGAAYRGKAGAVAVSGGGGGVVDGVGREGGVPRCSAASGGKAGTEPETEPEPTLASSPSP